MKLVQHSSLLLILLAVQYSMNGIVFSQTRSDSIVEGDSISGLHLKQSYEDTISTLGKPKGSDAASGRMTDVWLYPPSSNGKSRAQLAVLFRRDPSGSTFLINELRTNSLVFHTKDNLRVGSSLHSVERVYAHDERSSLEWQGNDLILDFPLKGVAYEFKDLRCSAIIVHKAGLNVTPLLKVAIDSH